MIPFHRRFWSEWPRMVGASLVSVSAQKMAGSDQSVVFDT
jgi:hypothetical protein